MIILQPLPPVNIKGVKLELIYPIHYEAAALWKKTDSSLHGLLFTQQWLLHDMHSPTQDTEESVKN